MHWFLNRYINALQSGGPGRKQLMNRNINNQGFDALQGAWMREEMPKILAAQAGGTLAKGIYLLPEVRDLAPPAAPQPAAAATAGAVASAAGATTAGADAVATGAAASVPHPEEAVA